MASLKTAKISIDVSGRAVRIIQTNGSGKIVRAGSAPIPETTVEDREFALRDAVKAAAASARIKGGKCVLLTGGPDIITQQFMLPEMPADALRENIFTEMTQYLSAETEKFTIDFRVTGQTEQPGGKAKKTGKNLAIFAAAFERTAAESMMRAVSKAGFTPERVDIRENARDKLMALKDKIHDFDPQASFAVLDVSDYPANIMIFVNGRFYVSRYFEATLNTETADGETATFDFDSLSAEIASIIDYIQYRERDSKIEDILIFGNKQSLPAIHEKLGENLEIPILDAVDVISGFVAGTIDDVVEKGAAYYLDAFAASINGKSKLSTDLNLKRQKKERRASTKAIMTIVFALLISGGAVAAGIYFPYTKIAALKEEEALLTRELANYPVADLLAQITGLENEINIITTLTSEYQEFYAVSPNASLILDAIYSTAPRNMEISHIAAIKGSITITGTAPSEKILANYMDELMSDSLDLFDGANLKSAYVSMTNVSFTITLTPANSLQEVE